MSRDGECRTFCRGPAPTLSASRDSMTVSAARIPIVAYLVLGDEPHLVAQECVACHARFFDHRIACAACGSRSFNPIALKTHGVLKTFTVINVAPGGVYTPYIAAVVDCDGTAVRTNIVHVEPNPDKLWPGMKLRLCTVSFGLDSDGVEAIGYAFEPES